MVLENIIHLVKPVSSASWTRLIPALRRVAELSQTVVYLGVQHVLGPCRPYDCLVGGLLVLVGIQRHPLAFLDLARDSGTVGLVAVEHPIILCMNFTVPCAISPPGVGKASEDGGEAVCISSWRAMRVHQ